MATRPSLAEFNEEHNVVSMAARRPLIDALLAQEWVVPLARLPFWPFWTSNRPLIELPSVVPGKMVITCPLLWNWTPVLSAPHCPSVANVQPGDVTVDGPAVATEANEKAAIGQVRKRSIHSTLLGATFATYLRYL
jgi:hypothetical protein